MPDIDKTALIKNWLGTKGFEMLTQAEKEKNVKHQKDYSKH